jgi:hypothetical protein
MSAREDQHECDPHDEDQRGDRTNDLVTGVSLTLLVAQSPARWIRAASDWRWFLGCNSHKAEYVGQQRDLPGSNGTETRARKHCVAPLWDDGNLCSIDLPELADLEDLGPRELARVLAELDVARRRVDALLAETVGAADRTAAYAEMATPR